MVLQAIADCYPFLEELSGEASQQTLLQFTQHVNKMVPQVSKIRQMSHMTNLLSVMA